MKIGILLYPTYGGSGVVATELGKSMAAKGHEVHFISYNMPARLSRYMENVFYHEVNVASYPLFEYPPYESALTGKLVDVVQHEGLDIIHAHYAIPHASAGFFAKQILKSKGIDIPIVTTLHGTDITIVGKDSALKPVVEFSIENSDRVTAVSESLKKDTYEHFNVSKEIEVIPNFINAGDFAKKDNAHFKKMIAPNGEKILIHTSNFRPVKRIQDVVYVFKKVVDILPAKLLLVGDGPERQSIEELCREVGVCDQITFLGKQDAIQDILSVSDVFLLPSQQESFGLAALEALACGVPVVSSNAGGIPELNANGVSGFTCEVGDVDAMAKACLHILEPEHLVDFKKRALERASLFSLDAILPQYEALYNSALKRLPA